LSTWALQVPTETVCDALEIVTPARDIHLGEVSPWWKVRGKIYIKGTDVQLEIFFSSPSSSST
jgi:hypothetical protein